MLERPAPFRGGDSDARAEWAKNICQQEYPNPRKTAAEKRRISIAGWGKRARAACGALCEASFLHSTSFHDMNR
jgi:hypothetical protein